MTGIILLILRALLILVLYTFIGLVLITTWKSLNPDFGVITHSISLTSADGSTNRTFSMRDIRIGSDHTNDLRIDAPTILPSHAQITFKNGNWNIKKVNKNAAVRINDRELKSEMRICNGDEIILADHKYWISFPDKYSSVHVER